MRNFILAFLVLTPLLGSRAGAAERSVPAAVERSSDDGARSERDGPRLRAPARERLRELHRRVLERRLHRIERGDRLRQREPGPRERVLDERRERRVERLERSERRLRARVERRETGRVRREARPELRLRLREWLRERRDEGMPRRRSI